jgi:2-dehydropantoate 2-reductase
MKICVLGAGSLGCAIGGTLAEGGNEVWLVNRSAERVAAIAQHGLIMRTLDRERTVKVHATTDCAEVGAVDLVILLVKSFHTRDAMKNAAPLIAKHTVVLSLQNGLGHEEVLADYVPTTQIMLGKSYVGGQLLSLNTVIAGTTDKETIIGEFDGTLSPRIQNIADVFNAAGLIAEISTNILGVVWDKIFVNVATGAVSAITGLPYGDLYQIKEIEDTALDAVKEAMQVSRAAGITTSFTDPKAVWLKAGTGLPHSFKPSMLQSVEKGSITEIDFVNGAVVRAGKKWGVPTPVNETLVACIKGVERRVCGP